MIIEKKINDYRVIGDVEEGLEETIQASIDEESLALIFENIANLYSDPYGSIVRELTSNCQDSHTRANVEDAIVVSIDMDEDTEQYSISFQDFGTGLSPDDMKKVFMRYGSSTNRKDNKGIGGFGYGSKSPFSYTDSFYINTIYNGKLYEYILHKGDEGIPKLENVSIEDTDERNGTKIIIDIINSYDLEKFRRGCIQQLAYFENVYYYDCDSYNDYNNDKIYKFEKFIFRENNRPANDLHLCIGPVYYRINFTKLNISNHNIPKAYYNTPIAVKLDIGEVDIIPSREDLKYTEKTINIINKKLIEVYEELKKLAEENIITVNNLKEWYDIINENSIIKYNDEVINIPYANYLRPKIIYKELDSIGLELSLIKERKLSQYISFFIYGKGNINATKITTTSKTSVNEETFNRKFYIRKNNSTRSNISKTNKCFTEGYRVVVDYFWDGKYIKKNIQSIIDFLYLSKDDRSKFSKIYKFRKLILDQYYYKLPNYEDIEVTEDEIVKYNFQYNKQVYEGDIKFYSLDSYSRDNYYSQTIDYNKFVKNTIGNVIIFAYKDKEGNNSRYLTTLSSILGNTNKKYLFILCNKLVCSLFIDLELQYSNYMYLDNIMKGKYKKLRKLAARLYVYKNLNYIDLDLTIINKIQKINSDVGNRLLNLWNLVNLGEMNRIRNSLTESEFEELYNVVVDNNIITYHIKSEVEFVNNWFKGFEILKYIKPTDKYQEELNNKIINDVIKFLKFHKKRVDKKYYNILTQEWEISLMKESFEKIGYLNSLKTNTNGKNIEKTKIVCQNDSKEYYLNGGQNQINTSFHGQRGEICLF